MSLIDKVLTKTILRELECKKAERLGGKAPSDGLNKYFIYDTDKGKFFIKVNSESLFSMYAAEVQGLAAIRETNTSRVPEVRFLGRVDGFSILILEHIGLFPHTAESERELGGELAAMHLSKGECRFGFFSDNTIGTTPQINTWKDNWIDFFVECRLEPQIKLTQKNYGDSEVASLGNRFIKKFASYFDGVEVVPALLHGDLWSGNTARDEKGRAVVLDPAVYFGHHEAEFGMLTLFGGFHEVFYQGYRSLITEVPGFEKRLRGYQLYHALNHYNLFGSTYRSLCLKLLSD